MIARAARYLSRWTPLATTATAMVFVLTAACAPSEPGGAQSGRIDKTYVGALQEQGALITLVTNAQQAVAYVCDGVEGSETVSGWFEGEVDGEGRFELSPVAGTSYEGTGADRMLSGLVGDISASGALVLGEGSSVDWTAEIARSDTAAGLYLYEDEVDLATLIVANDHSALGLTRSKITGWTLAVRLESEPQPAETQAVRFGAKTAEVKLVRSPTLIAPVIKPVFDPPPTLGNGTLMVMVIVEEEKAIGYRYAVPRADRIGRPTIDLTSRLQRGPQPHPALGAHMRVRLLDAKAGILSGQFIDDPLNPFIEVPEPLNDAKSSMSWIDVGRKANNFLVAVPNIRGGRFLDFTRFDEGGRAIELGRVDLQARALRSQRPLRTAQSTSLYTPEQAEHVTLVDNGLPEERVDLLFYADGFADTNADRVKFYDAIWSILNGLWEFPIYSELRPLINVHTVYVPMVHPDQTPFGVTHGCVDTAGNLIEQCGDLTADGVNLAMEIAANAPGGNYGYGGTDAKIVVSNSPEFAASAKFFAVVSLHQYVPSVVAHELGHLIVFLADEYETPYNPSAAAAAQTRVNVSGPIASLDQLKWLNLVHPSTVAGGLPTETSAPACVFVTGCPPSPLPPGTVGMYEGAGYLSCGSFRPTTYCRMRCRTDNIGDFDGIGGFGLLVKTFCPVCENAFRDVFEPFQPPTVDIYLRDNVLDTGAIPSPTGVEHPPGSGILVKPWHSVDVRVDAEPFGDATSNIHENPAAGRPARVFVTVHNRGSSADSAQVQVTLYWAPSTGGAPPFPGEPWTMVGSPLTTFVPGQNGQATVVFLWEVPPGSSPHTCLIATADSPADLLPPLTGGLSNLVRSSNNITWKNVHIVRSPEITGEISNYEYVERPIVFRIEAPDVPVETAFTLVHEDTIITTLFEPQEAQHMTVEDVAASSYEFRRSSVAQRWFSLATNLPPRDEKEPFKASYTLRIDLPGGTPIDAEFIISVDQLSVSPQGILGPPIGGNTYTYTYIVSLE